jgi:hypothetical protein
MVEEPTIQSTCPLDIIGSQQGMAMPKLQQICGSSPEGWMLIIYIKNINRI